MGGIYFETVLKDLVYQKVVTQNIFPFLSKTLWSRIFGCYSIIFSNLKQKKNATLLSIDPAGWSTLQRGKTLPKSTLDMKLNHLMVRF